MDEKQQIAWCHLHNAKVRFHNPNSLELEIKGVRKIYAYNLADAIKAEEEILAHKYIVFVHGCAVQGKK